MEHWLISTPMAEKDEIGTFLKEGEKKICLEAHASS
jgi:hypothetical protein